MPRLPSEALDGKINAVVVRDFRPVTAPPPRCRRRRIGQVASAGRTRSPMTVKDTNIAGLPTTWGDLNSGLKVRVGRASVQRLKAAGGHPEDQCAKICRDWQSYNEVWRPTTLGICQPAGRLSGGGAAALAALRAGSARI
jgi:hypothetical protein